MKIHQLKVDFHVTEQIKRYVYVYIIEGNNCYLIDSGVSGSEMIIEEYLRSIGRDVMDIRGIFLTHAHPDHIGTAAYFQSKTDCRTYASALEKRWIEDIDLQFKERPIPNFYQLAGKSSLVDMVVADGDCIALEEDFTIQVIGTPGHSADEISYIIGDSAFIGDTVPVKGDIPIYVNREDLLNSLRKLSGLSAIHTFYPAWDKTYSCEEMQEKVREAVEMINLLDDAAYNAQMERPEGDLDAIVHLVCEKVRMPHLMQNPLFKNTIKSHMQACLKPSQFLDDLYNHFDEDGRLLSRHGSVEFLTTMHYIGKYLRSGDRVLEIGAATGRYSHALARQGYTVDAVELVKHNIDVFQKNTRPDEKVTITQGNAMDLSFIPDGQYNVTLLLGPLYHLYSKEDKLQALREAVRVTKPGGVVFAAYVISDGCLLDEGFKRGNISVSEYIEKGLLDSRTFAAKSRPKDLFELVRKEDIDGLMSGFSVTRLHYVAADGCALFMREAVDAMDDQTFELYLKYHLATCEREDLLGITSHALDIFRK